MEVVGSGGRVVRLIFGAGVLGGTRSAGGSGDELVFELELDLGTLFL